MPPTNPKIPKPNRRYWAVFAEAVGGEQDGMRFWWGRNRTHGIDGWWERGAGRRRLLSMVDADEMTKDVLSAAFDAGVLLAVGTAYVGSFPWSELDREFED